MSKFLRAPPRLGQSTGHRTPGDRSILPQKRLVDFMRWSRAISWIGATGSSTAAASGTSSAVVPITVPGEPTIGMAVAVNALAAVNFTAPSSNGGSAISSYEVYVMP